MELSHLQIWVEYARGVLKNIAFWLRNFLELYEMKGNEKILKEIKTELIISLKVALRLYNVKPNELNTTDWEVVRHTLISHLFWDKDKVLWTKQDESDEYNFSQLLIKIDELDL